MKTDTKALADEMVVVVSWLSGSELEGVLSAVCTELGRRGYIGGARYCRSGAEVFKPVNVPMRRVVDGEQEVSGGD